MDKFIWKTEQRKINDLIPYENNPRKLSEKQKEDLIKSLEKFDLVEIPAINTNNKIISGHQRMFVMQLLGRGEEIIDVRIPDRELTEEEFKEYLIRSNKNHADWEFDILNEFFDKESLMEWGFEENELGREINNIDKEWIDMPEYNSENMKSYRKIIVHFANEENIKTFFELINQKYTEKTKFIWFPPVVGDSKKYEEYR